MKRYVALVMSLLLSLIAVPAQAATAAQVSSACLKKLTAVASGVVGKHEVPGCGYVETVRSGSGVSPAGAEIEWVTRTTTARMITTAYTVILGKNVVLWRVQTSETWTYNIDGDIVSYQNPPTITVTVPSPLCGYTSPATSGVVPTDDSSEHILAWGQVTMMCHDIRWSPFPGLPLLDYPPVLVRHEIRPHGDGTWS